MSENIQAISQGNYILSNDRPDTMYTSGLEYNVDNKISGYAGSAFAGGIPSETSGYWQSASDTVSSNSGAWGGSALPISAGPGIKLDLVNDTLIASVSGYVWQSASLYYSANPTVASIYTLSDSCSNYDKLEVDFYDINNWRTQMDCPIPPNLAASGTRGGYFNAVASTTGTGANIWFKCFNWSAVDNHWYCYCSELAGQGGSNTQYINANQPQNPPKVLQIIGCKRVGV